MTSHARRSYRRIRRLALLAVIIAGVAVLSLAAMGLSRTFEYEHGTIASSSLAPASASSSLSNAYSANAASSTTSIPDKPIVIPVTHIETPKPLKAVYMTSWVAGTPPMRDRLVSIIDETEVNAVVIDVKDYTGKIAWKPDDPYLASVGSGENRIRDIKAFISELHKKGVYVIARIAVLQDPYFVKIHPEIAVKRGDGSVWKDRKGLVWIDPAATLGWEYAVKIAEEAYAQGFDEANFDYVRFPSDGNMSDIAYPVSGDREKSAVIRELWSELGFAMKKKGIPSSVDIFGMTTTAKNDMNIGQLFENALPHFDYISPMAYPSHYPDGWNGWANPAAHPYEVMKHAIGEGVKRAEAASTSPMKIRPWLQDFDLGAEYGPNEVRGQIRALEDLGLDSWMLWDPSNRYTRGVLKPE